MSLRVQKKKLAHDVDMLPTEGEHQRMERPCDRRLHLVRNGATGLYTTADSMNNDSSWFSPFDFQKSSCCFAMKALDCESRLRALQRLREMHTGHAHAHRQYWIGKHPRHNSSLDIG